MRRSLGKMVVGNMLATAALQKRDDTAIICETTGRRISFGELDQRANRLANALSQAGFSKGDRVAFLLSNRVEMAEVYFALARSGIVGVPLNYRLAPRELDELMGAMGATGLIFDERFADMADSCRNARDFRLRVGAPDGVTQDYEAALSAATPDHPQVTIEEDDPFYFNLTSGTTGLPKSYIVTQFNNSAQAPFFQSCAMTSEDVVLTVFPTFGRVGFTWITAGLIFAIPNVLMDFDAEKVLRRIESEGVTFVNLVPTMAAMLVRAQEKIQADLSSLRGIAFTGSPLSDLVRKSTVETLCPNVYEFYGMQESGALTMKTPAHQKVAPGSVGKPILFSEVRILDDHGNDMPVDEVGEIVGRSPASVIEYFQNTEKSKETFRNGWLYTGDLGSIDANGFLTIRGRKKDLIVTGGQNVHAAEVEEILMTCPEVTDCAVFGLEDDFWGEVVSVLIIADEGAVHDEMLERHCRERLAGFKIPKRFYYDTAPLPRTPTGKVQKFLLREKFGEDAG